MLNHFAQKALMLRKSCSESSLTKILMLGSPSQKSCSMVHLMSDLVLPAITSLACSLAARFCALKARKLPCGAELGQPSAWERFLNLGKPVAGSWKSREIRNLHPDHGI